MKIENKNFLTHKLKINKGKEIVRLIVSYIEKPNDIFSAYLKAIYSLINIVEISFSVEITISCKCNHIE